MELDKIEKEAVFLASLAVHFDETANLGPAIFYYQEAAKTLTLAQNLGSQLENIAEKITQYTARSIAIQQIVILKNKPTYYTNQEQQQLDRVKFLFSQAMEEDENANELEAAELYTQTAELCLQIRNLPEFKENQERIGKIAKQAIERAESLKLRKSSSKLVSPVSPVSPNQPASSPRSSQPKIPSLGISNTETKQQAAKSQPSGLKVVGKESYSTEEIQVLKLTSNINGREYVPFMTVDLKERFAYPIPFSDRDGKLALSPKQKAQFKAWVRPDEMCRTPKMIESIDCYSIKQTVVSDCSFVASLSISAQYEKRFRKKLITRIIFPQNKDGNPIYNPCGKYMIKLHLNGVPRKIIIDDYLPISQSGEFLCSYSNNPNELWVSLLEKAYMKIMGGYDFPGSNSNIDLYALTGWIPERFAINNSESGFQERDDIFRKMLTHFHKGNVLLTIATGEMSEVEADRAGLVPTHAYAILDIKEIRGQRLFMLKNPWSHLRWKGNFSEYDCVHWTQELKRELAFDPKSAMMFDNGVFWIDYESIYRFFDVIYLNWNPSLFQYTYCTHQAWKAGVGPVKDVYNIGDNPQYILEIKSQQSITSTWILLTRHITDKEDFAQNKEYITVLVYKNNGKRVYYPHEPMPFIDGTRINSPHYLCKITTTEPGTVRYTLVISQYEKMNTIYYTLRAYSSCQFALSKIGNPYKYEEQVTGEWKGKSAGGCRNNSSSYKFNPMYQLQINSTDDETELFLELKGPKEFAVGFDLTTVNVKNSSCSNYFANQSSGAYRPGFIILTLERVPAGIYNIIPTTFDPGQESAFFLKVRSSSPISLARININ